MIVNLDTVRNSLVFSLCDSILHLDSIQDLARPRIRALIDSGYVFCSQQRLWDGRRRRPDSFRPFLDFGHFPTLPFRP